MSAVLAKTRTSLGTIPDQAVISAAELARLRQDSERLAAIMSAPGNEAAKSQLLANVDAAIEKWKKNSERWEMVLKNPFLLFHRSLHGSVQVSPEQGIAAVDAAIVAEGDGNVC